MDGQVTRWGEIWLGESFGRLLSSTLLACDVPKIPRVDCGSCRRVHEGNAKNDVRCCDIVPRLPNFLVGEILTSNPHPVILEWIAQRRCDPFYFLPPPQMESRYLQARKDGHFGLPCPLLEPGQGRCSVYLHRPAVCVSYYCYVPDMLWREAWVCLHSTLNLLQHAVAKALVQRAGFSMKEMAHVWNQAPKEQDLWEGDSQKVEAYQSFWQHHLGREAEFYRWCFAQVCEDASSLRREATSWHRLSLWSRLFQAGMLDHARETQLMKEAEEEQIHPTAPPTSLRQSLQKGAIEADALDFTLVEMEGFLLWYLQQIEEPSLWKWWKRRQEQRLF